MGDWTVHAPVATGSWGSVYEGRRAGRRSGDESGEGAADGVGELPGRVAMKFLPTGTMTPRQLSVLSDMVSREIRLHERLAHPRIVRLYRTLTVDDAESPEIDGCCVLIMELADGSLADTLRGAAGRPLPDAPRIITEICEGLAHLHDSGWVHGDLKPANILLMHDGSVRLADFGLTAEMESTHAYLTPAGSPDYLPPERWTEQLTDRGVAIRPTSDVWALGVTAYQLLAGAMPFPGGTPRARAANAAQYAEGRARLTLSADLPPGWRDFVRDCLAPGHRERAAWTASALHSRAKALTADPAALIRRPHPHRRRNALAGAAAAAVVTGGTIGGLMVTAPQRIDYAAYFNTRSDIPRAYYDLVVQAGTSCDEPGVTPATVAAMLKALSNWDPDLHSPQTDEYGIARWSPGVLWYYMPAGRQKAIPEPPFPPELSIPALGRYLCKYSTALQSVPGDRGLLLAAAFASSDGKVREYGGVPPRQAAFEKRVEQALLSYLPAGAPKPALPRMGTTTTADAPPAQG
ncbi:serine/threonine protein kinase [Streptomyces sp. NBC_00433]